MFQQKSFLRKLCLMGIFNLLVFVSCNDSNCIVYYSKGNIIKTCIDKGIYNLYIKSDSTNEKYHFKWVLENISAPSYICLDSVNNGYLITMGWQEIRIPSKDFRLNRNMDYLVELMQGDVAPYSIPINILDTVK